MLDIQNALDTVFKMAHCEFYRNHQFDAVISRIVEDFSSYKSLQKDFSQLPSSKFQGPLIKLSVAPFIRLTNPIYRNDIK